MVTDAQPNLVAASECAKCHTTLCTLDACHKTGLAETKLILLFLYHKARNSAAGLIQYFVFCAFLEHRS